MVLSESAQSWTRTSAVIHVCLATSALEWKWKLLVMPSTTHDQCTLGAVAQPCDKKQTPRCSQVSSEAVVRAYWRRVRDVEPLVNAVVDERFDAALKEARAADELVQRSSPQELERTKPLLGVPFITKCSVMVQ
ncbi:hypothetical protein V5799_031099, partial [Amblyomma americanum]